MKNVDYLCVDAIPKLPTNKHLSIHTMDIAYKQIKKVTKIRLFVFETSVFAKW